MSAFEPISAGALPDGWGGAAYDEIDSTNTEAMRRIAAGERGPLWLTARHQTAGRGRSGRAWASARRSLAATLLFAPQCEIEHLPQLSLVAGLAAHDVVTAEAVPDVRHRVRLKWPNDVLIDGAKVCGILVESSIGAGGPLAVIGTGINLGLPPEIDGRAVSSLAAHGSVADFDAVSAGLARALARRIAQWSAVGGFASLREAWLERAMPVGAPITVNAGQGPVAGTFAGLDADGALRLESGSGTVRRFTFGDVALGSP